MAAGHGFVTGIFVTCRSRTLRIDSTPTFGPLAVPN
jgi:hypothetical protein